MAATDALRGGKPEVLDEIAQLRPNLAHWKANVGGQVTLIFQHHGGVTPTDTDPDPTSAARARARARRRAPRGGGAEAPCVC